MTAITTTTEIVGTLDEMEPALREIGFTAVETMGGKVDLAEFDPYGMRRVGSVNIQTEKWAHHIYRGRLVYSGGKAFLCDAVIAKGPFLTGMFQLV